MKNILLNISSLSSLTYTYSNDTSQPYDKYFQDSGTYTFDAITDLHDTISFWLIVMVGLVLSIGLFPIAYYKNSIISYKDLTHGTIIELVWTILPALVLVAIAVPSFRVLYLSDEILLPSMTIKAIGHQWYWTYSLDDFVQPITFDSYPKSDDDLNPGELRNLDVDCPLVLPVGTIIRILTTSTDVIHSWAVPSLGIKLDAMPGRLNQTTLEINRLGTYMGQCSEICGTNHAYMPVRIDAVKIPQFMGFVSSNLNQ